MYIAFRSRASFKTTKQTWGFPVGAFQDEHGPNHNATKKNPAKQGEVYHDSIIRPQKKLCDPL